MMAPHHDGYAMAVNNYWIYEDPTSRRAVFLPHGMDQMFYEPQAGLLPDLKGALATAVLETPAGRTDFRARCVSIYTNLFPGLSNHVEKARTRIRPVLAEQGTNAVAKHDESVTHLHRRIQERQVYLERAVFIQTSVPAFDSKGVAQLSNWLPALEGGRASLTESNSVGEPALYIRIESSEKSLTARWVKPVLLDAGTYRFSARVVADQSAFRGPKAPASLRIWGVDEVQLDASRPNPQTMEIQSTFEVNPAHAGEFLLQCEVRGEQSPITYRFGNIRLTRLE